MNYLDFVEECREEYGERLELMMERIGQIAQDPELSEPYAAYFRRIARYLLTQYEVYTRSAAEGLSGITAAEGARWNEALYGPFRPGCYEDSFADPALCVKQFGKEIGQLLASYVSSLVMINPEVYRGCARYLCIYAELFVELYYYFEDPQAISARQIRECVRSFKHDYAELFLDNGVAEMIDPDFTADMPIVMDADLSDPAYLYRFGQYISENELRSREFLASLSEEQIQSMADTYTEGYRIGFAVCSKDISKKKTVLLYYPLGFERVMRAAVHNFAKIGLRCTLQTYSTPVNRQMDHDHREDAALWTDKEIVEYRIECYRNAMEQRKEIAPLYGGPAAVEVFGEEPFSPVEKPESPQYNEKQRNLVVKFRSTQSEIANQYVHGDERSFTIIAYPVASIGKDYEQIFAETVKLNTLDYNLYRDMQQKLIDVLDTAEYVHITGCGENRTDLYVKIHELADPAKETAFENCVADVNIPLGEVFTTPVLEGTNGKLHVTQVYLEGYGFKNLEIDFKDGMISSYHCSNFEDEASNRKYIEDNILFHHPTLPMGEFAVGTNTTAYRMAKKYHIEDKMPILIAEKTGPHFAVGDTCYSYDEDNMTWNPDGKAIIARDNSVSILRKTDVEQAYFNCHTDITIPYEELEAITVIRKDGTTADIIRNGRFVVEGTEVLNIPLDTPEE